MTTAPERSDAVRWWSSDVEQLPATPNDDDSRAAWVRDGFHDALAAEVATLAEGTTLVACAVLGGGTIARVRVLRSGDEPRLTDTLRSFATLGGYASATGLDPVGWTELVPIAAERAALRTGAYADRWVVNNDTWTTVARVVARHASLLEVAVEITKPPASTQAVLALAALRRERLVRRGRAVAASEPVPADAYRVRLLVRGDDTAIRLLQHEWTRTTGTDLRPPTAATVEPGGVEAAIRFALGQAVSAREAAQLLPLALIDEHSDLSVPRRIADRHAAAPVPSAFDVVIGTATDGSGAGFPVNSIGQHTLILGDTGYGKSTTVGILLDVAWSQFQIPSLIIDPIKPDFGWGTVDGGDGERRPTRHLAIGARRINPLVVPDRVRPEDFAAHMSEAFSSTTALDEAFPLAAAVSEAAFNRLYERTAAPTFADLQAAFMAETAHLDGESGRNVRASLRARLRALTTGAAGEAMAGGPSAGIDWAELSREPTVMTFANHLPASTLSNLYAFLIAGHAAWRAANPTDTPHVMVLEEAPIVFGAGRAAAVVMLERLLATMRSAGQTYIAVAQVPSQLEPRTFDLFPNAIAHRLHSAGDKVPEFLDADLPTLSTLQRGEALVRLGDAGHRATRIRMALPAATQPHADGAVAPNHRSQEFLADSPPSRAWCDFCPRPGTGTSWLAFADDAERAARGETDLRRQIDAGVRAAQAAAAAAGRPTGGPAQVYCATASAMTRIHSATRLGANTATSHVRSAIEAALRRSSTSASPHDSEEAS